MFKKLIMAGIASLVLVSGPVSAARDLQTFKVKISGDIIYENPESELVNVGNNKQADNIIFRRGFFALGDFWRYFDRNDSSSNPKVYDNGQNGVDCFSGEITLGGIHIQETKTGAGQAVFWFTSPFEGADKAPLYRLTIIETTGWVYADDPKTFATFPPTDRPIALNAEGWLMETEGRGQYRTTSCKGMDTDAGVMFTLERN